VPALCFVARQAGVEPSLIQQVHEVNEAQKLLLFHRLSAHFAGNLRGRTIAVWGIAFKPKTDDIREAPALTLIRRLLEAGAAVRASDPRALDKLRGEKLAGPLTLHADAYEALAGADALLICTEWNEYRSPDFDRIRAALRQPVIFDGRNLYTPDQMRRHGFQYYSIGRPPVR
jgi:UDPglucose 6-dehydrogenase